MDTEEFRGGLDAVSTNPYARSFSRPLGTLFVLAQGKGQSYCALYRSQKYSKIRFTASVGLRVLRLIAQAGPAAGAELDAVGALGAQHFH